MTSFCVQVAAVRADAGSIEEAELQVGRRAVFRLRDLTGAGLTAAGLGRVILRPEVLQGFGSPVLLR